MIHRHAVDSDLCAGRPVQLLPGWQLPEWAVHMLFPVRSQIGRLRRWCEELAADLASARACGAH